MRGVLFYFAMRIPTVRICLFLLIKSLKGAIRNVNMEQVKKKTQVTIERTSTNAAVIERPAQTPPPIY